MLADEVDVVVAVGVRPQPAFGAVEAGAVLVAAGKVPEGHGYVTTVDPFPVIDVIGVTNGAHPVLAVLFSPERKKKRGQFSVLSILFKTYKFIANTSILIFICTIKLYF